MTALRLRAAPAWACALAALMAGGAARAQDRQVDFRADEVSLDSRSQEIDARGNVQVSVPPFHLQSDHVTLRRSSLGVVVEGGGRLGFCPCLGTPLAVAFDGATVAPPHDVILRGPRLEVFGFPVLWAPWMWLRSGARFGLLPPDVQYRGHDGVFVGGGVHLPWKSGVKGGGLDLRGGGYVKGGAAVDATLTTESSVTRVRWDRLRDDGFWVDARGATEQGGTASGGAVTTVAWDADVLRGARGIQATTSLDAVARPFDRGNASAAWRDGGWTLATGVRTTNLRGGDVLRLDAFGPIASVRRADALGGAGAYDVLVEGGALRVDGGDATGLASTPDYTVSFGRGEAGTLLASTAGPFAGSLALRGVGDVVDDGTRAGYDGAASARARLGLPLARTFASPAEDDPWVHRIEPRVEAAVLGTRASGVLGDTFGRGTAVAPLDVTGAGWVASAGVSTSFGRWGAREAGQIDVSAGWVGDDERARPVLRGAGAVDAGFFGVAAEGASVYDDGLRPFGYALSARARIGPRDGLHLGGSVAGREGIDPVLARALTDAPLEPSGGFLAAEGWTVGGRVAVPWGRVVVTRAGADVDLTGEKLLAAAGTLELRDPCGCLVVRLNGSHRLAREGVDVWLTVDLPVR